MARQPAEFLAILMQLMYLLISDYHSSPIDYR